MDFLETGWTQSQASGLGITTKTQVSTLPRLGSRVRIPSSAPNAVLSGAPSGALWLRPEAAAGAAGSPRSAPDQPPRVKVAVAADQGPDTGVPPTIWV